MRLRKLSVRSITLTDPQGHPCLSGCMKALRGLESEGHFSFPKPQCASPVCGPRLLDSTVPQAVEVPWDIRDIHDLVPSSQFELVIPFTGSTVADIFWFTRSEHIRDRSHFPTVFELTLNPCSVQASANFTSERRVKSRPPIGSPAVSGRISSRNSSITRGVFFQWNTPPSRSTNPIWFHISRR